jgi:hypothetical protein
MAPPLFAGKRQVAFLGLFFVLKRTKRGRFLCYFGGKFSKNLFYFDGVNAETQASTGFVHYHGTAGKR